VPAITAAGARPGGFSAADAQGLDLEGRFVIPGLWDEHVHMTQWALAANRIDLSGAASASAAVELVRKRITATDPGAEPASTVVGAGFRDAMWDDTPSARMLDDATHGVATALIGHDLHCV
jgi:predicted amidohydrolase YtcJ